jgi:asparagine synthase (glutamine-hydrolysing)
VCGICGVVALGRPADVETTKRMSKAIAHRGPDGDGIYASDEGVALGFRRLAIIDLSDAGLQPFASEDGALQLVHNGEVYNYRELRRELEGHGHTFRSATDTEVILRAYEQWGERCVERFNGMWALVIWDARTRKLFCSRDRFGIKPFYYHWDGRRLVFASEPKAFRGVVPLRANTRAVRDYLEQSYLDHTDETFFESIRRLPPAHNLVLDRDGMRLDRYWRLEPKDAPQGDPVEAVREQFLDSLRLHLRSDVPVGTCLSGGIDSSSIVVGVDHLLKTERDAASAVGERQKTFTAYFDDAAFDERPYARAVVDATKVEPHWITFTDRDLADNVETFVETQDEPFGSTSMVAQWFVMREAKRAGLTVMLDGQGGDEIFAGYRAHVGYFLGDLLTRGQLKTFGREVATLREQHSPLALLTATARPFAPERVTRFVRGRARSSSPLVGAALRADATLTPANGSAFPSRLRRYQELLLTRRGLPELLRYEDRNSMAHSLEARVPFLDFRLVELAFSLEPTELIRQGTTKSVIRRALGDLLPAKVAERRDKLGFVTPEARFMRGALGDLAGTVFASPELAERGFVDATAVRERLRRHRAGELDAGFELWRALNVELWARRFLD